MRRLASLAASVAALAAWPAAAAELLMFEEAGCGWCERWNEDIGGIYAITEEGKRAPLRRIDISDPLPEGVELKMRARFTPTFVLIEDGREVGRIEGYPGPDFFWPLLDRLLEKLPERADADGAEG